MVTVPYALNRYVGPFFMGLSMAGSAAATDPVSVGILMSMACICGFISLPGNDRLLARFFDAMI